MLIMDICEFLAGGWFFGMLNRHRLNRELQIKENDLFQREDNLNRRMAAHDLLEKLKSTEDRLKSVQGRLNGDDLETLTAQDAIRRENRAKAALKSIMEKDGCSQESIEDVMRSVDGAEDGDLKT